MMQANNTRARAAGWISADETALSMRRFDLYRSIYSSWSKLTGHYLLCCCCREGMTLQIDAREKGSIFWIINHDLLLIIPLN
jgi:hypothetical protein